MLGVIDDEIIGIPLGFFAKNCMGREVFKNDGNYSFFDFFIRNFYRAISITHTDVYLYCKHQKIPSTI
jgi:hypothetical protein